MKLIYRITLRLSLLLSAVLAVWAVWFYIALMDEINDEADDALEDYSEQLIIRFLSGEELASQSNHSNNQYYLSTVTAQYAQSKPHIHYVDSMVYIPTKRETEPARILTTIYKDAGGQYHELVVSTPTIEKQDLKKAILYWMVFLYVGLLLVIIAVNVWVYYRSNRPLYKLLAWMDQYTIGEKNDQLNNNTTITEFKKLNESAVRNMKRAEEVFEEQKQFIYNVSHEIQTPVAVCRNRIETLMEDEALTESQLQELAKTQQTLEYITKLNKSLLLLSKIENGQFTDKTNIELNRFIPPLIEDYKEVYAYMNIETKITQTGTFSISMSQTLAGILIHNMIKNSYVHNKANGHLLIEISSSKLVFKNTGIDTPLDSNLIFERFYQSHKKEGSTGLGLALAKSICDREKLHIRYSFSGGIHCFEILF